MGAVLTGCVRQIGDRLTIGAELIDAANDSQLWGEHYSRPVSDVLAIEEEIASEICDRLRPRLTPVFMSTERYACEDVTIRGVTIPQGEMTLGVIGSANRDETVFENPDVLRGVIAPGGTGGIFRESGDMSFGSFDSLRESGESRRHNSVPVPAHFS